MKIQAIKSFKPMTATSLKAEAKGIQAQSFKNTPIQSTMGRDLVSFKGKNIIKNLPTINKYLPDYDRFSQKGIDAQIAGLKAANDSLEKVVHKFSKEHGMKSTLDLDTISAKSLKKQLKKVIRSIENAFAEHSIEKKFLAAKINEPNDKASFNQLKALKEELVEARNKVDLTSSKKGNKHKKALKQRNEVNQKIFTYLEKTGDNRYLSQMNRMKADIKALIDPGFEILM